jgi:iron complex outermembrane receptor protein
MLKDLTVVLLCTAGGLAALPGQLAAQRPPTPTSASTPASDLATTPATDTTPAGDIIVTAQRRSESLQRTPVAISVLSNVALQKQAIVSEADLQVASPGLTVRAGQNSNQLNYAIRGQSLDAFSNTRPGVVAYVNEVQIGGDGGATAFYDLQSIQILKGPQGTLFGRNATGGAVVFTTVKPGPDFGGYISGRLGNYDLRQVEGAMNVPLDEGKVRARVAGFYENRDGYQRDLFKGRRVGNVDRFGLRGSLSIDLTGSLRNELVVDYLHSDGSNLSNLIDSLNPSGPVPVIALTAFGNQQTFNGIINAFTGGQAGCNQTTRNCAAIYAAANPKLDPRGIASYLQTQKARGPYRIESDGPNKYLGRNTVVSNITTLDLANEVQFKNIFGYTHLDTAIFGDIDGIPYGIDDNGAAGKLDLTRQFSDEAQIIGKALDSNLSYVVGGYFANERKTQRVGTYLFTGLPIAVVQLAAGRTRSTTLAGYAQSTYQLEDATGIKGLGITGGVRYTYEKIKYDVLGGDQFRVSPQPNYDFNQQKSYGNVSWTIGLQDQINSSLLVYAVSRRSYRNGGYNVIAAPIPGLGSVNGGNGFGKETVTDGELGMKLRDRLGTMPVQLNVAVYRNWIKDNQRVAYALLSGAPAAVAVNVPRARVQGFEVDGSLRPTSWLNAGGALNYTDADFTSNRSRIAGGNFVVFGTYPDTPKWSGSVFGELSVPIGDDRKISLRSDYYAQSKFFYTSTGNTNPGAQISGYDITNFRLGLDDDAAGWSITANLKNAFKKVYYVGGIATGELFQFNTVVPGAPRTFLIEGRFKF